MEYQTKLSKLRHLALKVQGQDLQQVLLRAAAKRAMKPHVSLMTRYGTKKIDNASDYYSTIKFSGSLLGCIEEEIDEPQLDESI